MSTMAWLPMAGALAATLTLAAAVWVLSVINRDVSIVDSAWSLLIVLSGAVFLVLSPEVGVRAGVVMVLAGLWGARLAIHITVRGWGEAEDRRYQEIRARNQPHFQCKSLYLVFALQAVLAWIVSFALIAAIAGERPWHWLDAVGVFAVVAGAAFEAIADWQLYRFQSAPDSGERVLDSGLWRYSRHPNYFGEFCVWWGFFLLALAAGGAWWALASPLLMSVLLLRVSGVTLLEKDISSRRPGYRRYAERTNAFFPWRPQS